MKHVYAYFETYRSKVIYKFHTFSFDLKEYRQMEHYPKDAVIMYRNRRKIMQETYRKQDQEEGYKEKLTQEMEKMTLQAKRNAQR